MLFLSLEACSYSHVPDQIPTLHLDSLLGRTGCGCARGPRAQLPGHPQRGALAGPGPWPGTQAGCACFQLTLNLALRARMFPGMLSFLNEKDTWTVGTVVNFNPHTRKGYQKLHPASKFCVGCIIRHYYFCPTNLCCLQIDTNC